MKNLLYIFLGIILFSSCDESYIPKQLGYHKIDLPEHKYLQLQNNSLPYTFEHSVYSVVKPHRKSNFSNPNWIDIVYPDLNASVELTYKQITKGEREFNKMVNDARKLTNKHNIKAYAIDETAIKTPNGINVSIFELDGDVPSQFQFYATDSTEHFFRGALYFRTSTKNDSLRPVINYISYDIVHMLNTLNWNESVE